MEGTPSFTHEEITETFEMIMLRHLNVRTVTLGINLLDCVDLDFDGMRDKIRSKIMKVSRNLVNEAELIAKKYNVEIVNKRLAVTPAAMLLEPTVTGLAEEEAEARSIELAETLDKAAEEVNADFIGGFGALVQRGMTNGDRVLINSLPKVLSTTQRVCSCINIATTKSGINVDAALKMGEIIKQTAKLTRQKSGWGCVKLVTFANAPEDNPFMAGAFHGIGRPESTVNVGISAPGVVRAVVEKNPKADFRILADIIKRTAFKVTRVGELVGQELSRSLGINFGIVDLSLAPTPVEGDSIAGIIESMGIDRCGAPGSTAALALLTDAVKKGGSMATSFVGGLSGAFIPVTEDSGMVKASVAGALSIEKLEAMTSVCSTGLDMIPIPGDTPPETISAIILDEMSIGIINDKPVGVRLIPVPGKKAGDRVNFGGLLGGGMVMPVSKFGSKDFVRRGGQIPSAITSLNG